MENRVLGDDAISPQDRSDGALARLDHCVILKLPSINPKRLTLSDDTSLDAIQRKRLYWHSRRGMWELDLLLIPFLEQRYDSLEADDQAAFRQLIDEEDQDLFAWMMRREWPEDEARRRIVKMIVHHAESIDSRASRAL